MGSSEPDVPPSADVEWLLREIGQLQGCGFITDYAATRLRAALPVPPLPQTQEAERVRPVFHGLTISRYEPAPPDEPLDVETEKLIAGAVAALTRSVAHLSLALEPGQSRDVTVSPILRALVRDVRRPVEQEREEFRREANEQASGIETHRYLRREAERQLSEARQALEAAHRVRRAAMESMERARPLCPDHRDKQRGEECLACKVEAAGRDQHTPAGLCRITELRERAEAAEAQVADLERRGNALAEGVRHFRTCRQCAEEAPCAEGVAAEAALKAWESR